MDVFVLGGTRFVGRAIVDRLLRDGHAVTLMNRGVSDDPFGTQVSRILGDRKDPSTLDRAFRRADYDVVVDVTAYHESDTEALIERTRERVGHLVHISTASVYLIRDGLLPPFAESDYTGRLTPRPSGRESSWLYGYHKRRCEDALQRAWENDRFPFTVLRLPMVVGVHDYTRRALAYFERIASRGAVLLPDGGLNSWGFLWVDDVADVVANNLANSAAFGRAYNLAQREALSVRQFVEFASDGMGVQPNLVHVPTQWLESVGLGTSFSPYSHQHDILLDCRLADTELLFRPTPARSWVAKLIDHFLSAWDGTVRSHAATRATELELATELSRVRLSRLRAVSESDG